MAISVGSVEVDVIPNTQGILARLQAALVPPATQVGDEVGEIIGKRIAAKVGSAVRDGINDGARAARPAATRQGDDTGGAFARAMKARLEAAFKSLPKINIGADTSEADSDLQALRARMETLAGKRIGIEIDAAEARTEISDIEEQLRRLGASHPNVAVRADTAAAIAQLQAVREEIDRVSANPGHIRLETDGTLGQRLRAAVAEAEASLPNINIDADTTPAQAEIASLRSQLTALRDVRIGIDMDAGAALARIEEIQVRLARLSASNADIAVRVDAGAASSQLLAVGALASALDAKRVNINVSAAQAMAAVFQLSVAIAGLAAIPAIPILAAGIGSIAAAGVAAGAGVGALAAVAIPAFKGIASTLQAQKTAQDAATTASIKGGQAAGQGAAKALQLAGAQQALASAERNGARQIAQAQQQVQQAKTAAADAIVQAAQRNAQAARQVQDAEKALVQSQKDAKQAQLDLTAARKQAGQELEDLANRYVDAQLSQRDAALGVQEAQQRLAQVNAAGSKATVLERQQAQLAYDQALQRLREQTTDTKRLKDQQAEAAKTGVKGTDTYKQAQDQLAKAQQNVADKTQAVGDAQTSAAQTQVQSARQIADAQQRVSEATANVAVAQQSAADAVSSAQRQIASASQSAAGGVDQAAVAQAKYQAELAKLTPAARGTFNAFLSLKTAFSDWSKALQPAVMPLFTRALVGLKNALPGLTPFVLAAAKAIGTLQDRASAGFKSPWWKGFKKDLAGSVGPAIVGLGVSFGRIFKGMAGVIQAFLPHMNSISATMQRITGRFATWGTSLKGSPKFERFLAYAAQQGPVVARAMGDIGGGLFDVSRALSPLSGPVLQSLGAVARAVGSIARDLPWLLQLLYLAFVATKLWTLAMVAFNLVADANPITLIVLAIVALVAAVIYAYKNFGWFRDLVNTVWAAIQTAVLFAWNTVLKPTFDAIWGALQTIGRWATWLWQTVLKPVFSFISEAARLLFTALVVIAILPIILAVKLLGAHAQWLWNTAFKPTFNAIAAGAMWLWKNYLSPIFGWIGDKAKWLWNNAVKPAFALFKQGMVQVGDQAKALWKNVISPVFGWIGDRAKWLWANVLKPQFALIKSGVGLVGDAFKTVVGAIKTQWDKLEGIAKKPVAFIVNTVYSKGLRPTWNNVAKAFGAPQLPAAKGFAQGGVLPGYTPGRDVHRFTSPTGGGLDLSGGEAIMRPEFTRGVGSGFVSYFNGLAKSSGASGVRAALAPVLGGNPNTPTDRSLAYKDGGIFGWIGKGASAVAGAGSAAWNGIKDGASWLTDTLEGSARAGVKAAVSPLLAGFPGMDTGFGQMLRKVPDHMIDALFGYSKDADTKGAGGIGGPKIQTALNWVKTQAGKPYQWGGNGNPSWDCSGLQSAIESVIRGQKPHRRWATGAFSGKTAPPGWVLNGNSPFRIGITNAGVGHTAGTLGKTNVESSGGAGVHMGASARGWNDPMFTSHYGFMPGKFDSGGYLQPGMNLAYNGTGRPEPVFTSQQANALTQQASAPAGGTFEGALVLDSGEFLGRVRGEVHQQMAGLTTVLRAGRTG
ncbi:MAG TPA: hypothetical protein VK698_39805 [Kofleriaceae bacterium]|nr:hypothetical protein [Kofleriaceae bacterium]